MWLYGAAGAGKSAIAKAISELCEEHKSPLVNFFRADSWDSNSFPPSLTRLTLSSSTY